MISGEVQNLISIDFCSRERMRESSSSGQLAGPDGFDKWADPKATFRLHEGISNPSRAEDQAHLHRLQKSSTKPRSGE